MMMSQLICILLPAVAISATAPQPKNADRHVRVAHDGEPVSVSIQADGRVMKEEKRMSAVVKEHGATKRDKNSNTILPHVGEVKSHEHADQAKGAETVIPGALPEGMVLLEMAAAESEEPWSSAFFFLGALVLIVILAGMAVSGVYYSKQKSEQAAAVPRKADLKTHDAPFDKVDSSSTSDSGEKIAMLFDRVRKSLEDLGDKEQADVAGGKVTTNTL